MTSIKCPVCEGIHSAIPAFARETGEDVDVFVCGGLGPNVAIVSTAQHLELRPS